MKPKTIYYVVFNLIAKFIGAAFICASSLMAIWAITDAFQKESELNASESILAVAMAVVVNVLGILIVMAKSHYPKGGRGQP